jgi:integrase
MRFNDLSRDGVWTIPTAPREKQHGGVLKLPDMALRIIHAQPRFASNPYVFAGRDNGPLTGLGPLKRDLDKRAAEFLAMRESGGDKSVEGWRLHDCRRVARSLMSRAGVEPHVAERVLGHAVGSSVERVYDQHQFEEEKAHALQRLADAIEGIINPPPVGANVLKIPAKGSRRKAAQ